MAISRVQTGSGNSQNDTTSFTMTFGSNVTVGNVIAVAAPTYWSNAGQTVTGVTDNLGNTYTRLNSGTPEIHAGSALVLAYGVITTGGACTITVTWSAPVFGTTVLAHELSGVDTASPIDRSAYGNGEGTSLATSSVTTTVDGAYLFVCAGNTGSSTWTAGSGYTTRLNVTHGAYANLIAITEDQTQVAAGAITGEATQSGAANATIGLMAFKPAVAVSLTLVGRTVLDYD